MESETVLTPMEKIPSTGGSQEVQNHDTASRRTASPTHYQLSNSSPLECVLNEALWAVRIFHLKPPQLVW